MGPIESRFADIIWQSEPVSSPELVRMAAQELTWKKSTTYTVLKRLCERGIFQNQGGGTVTSLLSRKEFYAVQSEHFVEETFHGSLPAFLTAFTTRKKLSQEEIVELQALIDQNRGGHRMGDFISYELLPSMDSKKTSNIRRGVVLPQRSGGRVLL